MALQVNKSLSRDQWAEVWQNLWQRHKQLPPQLFFIWLWLFTNLSKGTKKKAAVKAYLDCVSQPHVLLLPLRARCATVANVKVWWDICRICRKIIAASLPLPLWVAPHNVREWKLKVSRSPFSSFASSFALVSVYFSSAVTWPELNTSFQIVIVWPGFALFYFSILMKVLNACWAFNMMCQFLSPFLNSLWFFLFY